MRSVFTLCVSVLLVCSLVGAAPVAAAGAAADASITGGDAVATAGSDTAVSAGGGDAVATAGGEAAGNESFPVTLTDATGTDVTVEERPERVTTTNPSAAQIMWELGAEEQVVGLTQFAHYLEGAESRRNVSATEFGVSIERVVDTEPDLVLVPNETGPDTVERLREAGLTVYHSPEAREFEDVANETTTIGRLTGNTEAAAETNAWMWENVEAVETLTAEADRPHVMYPLSGGFVVGGDTFINEIIVAGGGENVAAGEFDGYQQLSDERVLALDPEVLVVTDQSEGEIMTSEPYSLTTAGQENRSVRLDVNYLNQPAPRSVVYSTRNLSAQLYPDQIDPDSVVADADAAEDGSDAEADEPEGDSESTPGFGVGVALVAIGSVALVARRRTRGR